MDATLAKKLKRTGRRKPAVIAAPAGYDAGAEASIALKGRFDWIQLFVRTEKELSASIAKVVRALEPESILWITFPKGSSKIQTDLTRDRGWDSVKQQPLKWITLVSIDDTWSAFGLRPLREGEAPNFP